MTVKRGRSGPSPAPIDSRPALSRAVAWREVGLTAVVLWLVLGGACFFAGAQWVCDKWGRSLNAALALDVIFLVGCLVVIGLVLAFGEEIAVRGLILDRLGRCRTSRLVQIVVTGAVMGVYHGVVGHHVWPSYMAFSFVLFGILSAFYVYGGRSLTPAYIAHAMTHFLGDPALMQGILYGVAGG